MSNPNAFAMSRRALLGGTAAITMTGCYGSFNLTGVVYDWNGSFSSKWVRWLVFLGLVILPVYGVILIVDALVLNTIEFFSGEHPVTRSELEDGSTVVAEKTDDPKVTRLRRERAGKPVATLYCERRSADEMVLMDARKHVLSVARRTNGGIELRDARGRRVAFIDDTDLPTFQADMRAHGSPAAALQDRIAKDSALRMAALRHDIAARAVL